MAICDCCEKKATRLTETEGIRVVEGPGVSRPARWCKTCDRDRLAAKRRGRGRRRRVVPRARAVAARPSTPPAPRVVPPPITPPAPALPYIIHTPQVPPDTTHAEEQLSLPLGSRPLIA